LKQIITIVCSAWYINFGTIFIQAIQFESYDALDLLIKAGANIDEKTIQLAEMKSERMQQTVTKYVIDKVYLSTPV
jgi:hypothetical protein